MSRLQTALHALTETTDPTTTLAAFTLRQRTAYPGGLTSTLDAARQKQLRRLERDARMALRTPPTTRYHVWPGDAWHVLLAPHAAHHRLYLARAGHQHHYTPGDPIAAPSFPPATLLAHWTDDDQPLAFAHVTTREQLDLLMYTSTAHHHVYVTPLAAQRGVAATFTTARTP